ncbi:FepA family TonB-dependent siderophore receptor [Parathalassolituus penaei]|uniref:FepA family TonB-dependent siderophore receptor n=1 Tax=Parathalassolituus penaei TaxID=2997323 RepID=A0A9X3EA91_9GAMM|nr:FepA family TonB-dependent siderophore receptor [Parathalassolituus penaei]MCY0963839.1 FepA family TonB-dependent siderophore receptor [Parathalassolituus penaei]
MKAGYPILMSVMLPILATHAVADDTTTDEQGMIMLDTLNVVDTAAEQLKQAQGVSVITAEDLQHRPVSNDIAELVRTMPGVNLSGSSSTGQYGNNRQIDIRGMGPENTLILIDGKPVLSRDSVKMGRSGERNTRGDSNWVPAEMIERIEVIRGPAAARYGSGAAGGVVNIITKKPEKSVVQVSGQLEVPENSDEGGNQRVNLMVSGPVSDNLSHRTYVNYNKSEADSADLNRDSTVSESADSSGNTRTAAGQEGVRNVDVNSVATYRYDAENRFELEGGFSRQGNIYAGDNAFQGVDYNDYTTSNIGSETNIMKRGTVGLTHRGEYDVGNSMSYIQLERTVNTRLSEGNVGGTEGAFNSDEFVTTSLNNLSAKTEWNLPVVVGGLHQTVTLGGEYRLETLNDNVNNQSSINVEDGTVIPGTTLDASERDPNVRADLFGLYVEDNLSVRDDLTLTGGLRFDHHGITGNNVSPSINAKWLTTDRLSFQAGVSKAFKAPNLYQLNPNYVYTTRGTGCPVDYPSLGGGCSILGNADLKNETSINKEIGVNYSIDERTNMGLTWFHNDYRNKISTDGTDPVYVSGTTQIFRWENIPEAVVSGLEGSLRLPVMAAVDFSLNGTLMLESENKSTGEALSIIPHFTLNSTLSWQVQDNWEMVFSGQHYGHTESPTQTSTGSELTTQYDRPSYSIFNVATTYNTAYDVDVSFSVKNLFDKEIRREGVSNTAGANTYNEPGRSYLIGLTKTF